ncbi:MAG: hypothetical protein ACXWZP_06945 [Gaiellaceae bacterium]
MQLGIIGNPASGAIEAVHVQPWSTVLRVPTGRGDAYFKANTPALRHEAAVVALLAERRPDCMPQLLAVDRTRGWMLMADAGTRLRELIARERELTRWLDVLPLYASLQIDLSDRADELVALGVPDMRLEHLPARYERLLDELEGLPADEARRLREAVPHVEAMSDELAAVGLPETIQHDDLNEGQVYLCDGRYLLLDWGDACVSHPFFSMSVALEGVIAWGIDDVQGSVDVGPFRDAYLEPFARNGERDPAELNDACTTAMRLGWVCRAVNGYESGSEDRETQVRLRMFLDGRP